MEHCTELRGFKQNVSWCFTLKLSVLFLSSAESYEIDTQLGEVLHAPTNAKNGPDTTCIYVTKSSALISSFPFGEKHRGDSGWHISMQPLPFFSLHLGQQGQALLSHFKTRAVNEQEHDVTINSEFEGRLWSELSDSLPLNIQFSVTDQNHWQQGFWPLLCWCSKIKRAFKK